MKCTTSAVCALFAGESGVPGTDNAHFQWPFDVAVDSGGNVFVSDNYNYRIQKFNSAGVYQSTIGVTGVPYLSDNSHFNKPWGIALATDNSMYILENEGYRLIKLNSSGVFQWSVGQAGTYGSDNAHFGSDWAGVEGSPAIDTSGRVYVGDTGNNRVQIFNSNGSYYATLGSWGTGNYEFSCPTDIAINPINGDIYVTDHCNHRIQVFTSSLVYKATLGATGTPGSDNLHFSSPWGVTVDNSGNIFVADSENHRIQKCVLIAGAPGYACSVFAGVSGVSGNDFGHLGNPLAVKVDASGRVYVADEWNSRVQVLDASGAYLTTIGGAWGTNSGDMINPSGIALDSSGNVYVTDRDNHRIQKFALGVPGWRQSNINGFGDPANYVATLGIFNGQMYAGGTNIWSTATGNTWTPIVTNIFSDPNNSVDSFAVFNNALYVGTANYTSGASIYKTTDGTTWQNLMSGGFGSANNADIANMVAYNGYLYAGVLTNDGTGKQIWRSPNGITWSSFTFGTPSTWWWSFEVYNGLLYVSAADTTNGILYRTDGSAWTAVTTNGFGDSNNVVVHGLAAFNGYLYAATRNLIDGAQIWRSSTGDPGSWTKIASGGLGDPNNKRGFGLIVAGNYLYFDVTNLASGDQVFRTTDGATWQHVGIDGWGDSKNTWSDYMDKNAAVFNNSLYIGAGAANGGQIWQTLNQIYLPLILR